MEHRSRPARRAIAERRAAGRARPGGDRGRPLRPVLRLRRAPRGLRAPRRRARSRTPAEALGATYRGAPRAAQGALAAFSFNGNKIITTSGGGMLVSGRPRLDRARAQPLDAGARAGAALRAHRDRLQLPDEQPAGRARARAARDAADAGRGAPRGSATGTASCSTASRVSRSCPRRRTGRRTPG